jgi:DNA-binding IclR family transcriptional regulator
VDNYVGDRAAPQYPIETVDKALRLLLMFGERAEVRLTDVHAELGIGKSRAHRLLAMLVLHRFAVQDPWTRTYRPGPALAEIGLSAVRRIDIRIIARPLIEAIAEQTGETVHLGVLEERNVRFVDGVESEMVLRVAGRVGRLLPAYATSLGKAMLAQLPKEAVTELYPDSVLPPVTAASIRLRAVLLAELDEVRERGYAINHGESEEGVSSIGVALPLVKGAPSAAISIAAPSPRLAQAQLERTAAIAVAAVQQLAQTTDNNLQVD